MKITLPKSKQQSEKVLDEARDFLPGALAIQQRPPSPTGRTLMWLLILLFSAGVAWASFGQVDIVATAQGKVIPNGKSKVIQSAVAGTVDEIHVENGDKVNAGDLIISLNRQDIDATLEQLEVRLQSSMGTQWRLRALLSSAEADAELLLVEKPDVFSQSELNLAQAQYNTFKSERNALSKALQERTADLRVVEIEQQKWQEQLPLIQSRARSREKLLVKNHMSKDDWRAFEQNRIEAEYSTALAEEKKQVLNAAIEGINAQEQQLISARIETWELQLRDETETVTQLEKELLKAKTESDAHDIRAPVTGHVQELVVNTEGAVLSPAEPLLKVVPNDTRLEVETMVANKDIGFIREGQEAKIKIDAFPFTRFGAIEGTIKSISSDAIEDRERGWVYRTSVSLSKDTLNIEDKDIRISPGMSVAVEVKTGKRQLMEFFMSPLLRYRDESVRER